MIETSVMNETGAMRRVAGIDVSKRHLDVCADGREVKRFANSAVGIGRLLAYLRAHRTTLGVCEASGGYERALVEALVVEMEVSRVHPPRVRSFARASGVEAKTDALDARLLREYGLRVDLPLLVAEDPQAARLRTHALRRRQLVDMRTQESNRQEKAADADCAASHRRMLDYLGGEIAACERVMAECMKAPGLVEQAGLYTSVYGVGPQTAAVLLACLPELGVWSGPALVALVGLAPFNRDSGRHPGRRSIRGGRAMVRHALYMAAMSVLRHDCELRNFYRGLKKRGKPGKVALVAVMRKLLLQLNAVAHRGTPWVPKYNPNN